MPRCPHGSALRTMRRPAPASPRSRLSSRSQPLPNEGEETLNTASGGLRGILGQGECEAGTPRKGSVTECPLALRGRGQRAGARRGLVAARGADVMIFDTIHVATITATGHGASVAAPTQRGQELPWQRQRLKGPTLTHPKTVARGQGAVRPICWFAVGESGVFYPPASSGHCGASSHPSSTLQIHSRSIFLFGAEDLAGAGDRSVTQGGNLVKVAPHGCFSGLFRPKLQP